MLRGEDSLHLQMKLDAEIVPLIRQIEFLPWSELFQEIFVLLDGTQTIFPSFIGQDP